MSARRLQKAHGFLIVVASVIFICYYIRMCLLKKTFNANPNISSITRRQNSTCKAKNNITFLKTHKTASTTVQNILLRWGIKHQLKFALPTDVYNFGYPKKFTRLSVAKQGQRQNNVLCHHMRFNHAEVEAIMPKNTIYITILREPGKLFESAFDYFWPDVPALQHVPHYGNDSIERWLDNASAFMANSSTGIYNHLAKNPVMFDLGFSNSNESNLYINSSIEKIDKMFDLVMIADYFSESVVLLADLLCWDIKDVGSLHLNSRNVAKDKIDMQTHYQVRSKARLWNKADAVMFDYFNKTFWRKVNKYGHERMKRDVEKLREINEGLMTKCIEGGKAVDYKELKDPKYKETVFKPRGVSVKAFNLKNGAELWGFCHQLIASENSFTSKIFDVQQTENFSMCFFILFYFFTLCLLCHLYNKVNKMRCKFCRHYRWLQTL